MEGYQGYSLQTLDFSPNGQYLALGDMSSMLTIWDVASGKLINTLTGHENNIRKVQFSPDGKTLVSVSGDDTVRFWEVPSGKQRFLLVGFSSGIKSVVFDPNGKTLYSSDAWSGGVRAWDLSTAQEIHSSHEFVDTAPLGIYGNPPTLIIGNGTNLELWDAINWEKSRSLLGDEFINHFAIVPNTNQIWVGLTHGQILVQDLNSGDILQTLESHESYITWIEMSAKGNYALSASNDVVYSWDINTGQTLAKFEPKSFADGGALSSTGEMALIIDGENIHLVDTLTFNEICLLEGHRDWVETVTFSPDDTLILSGARDETVQVWETQTCQQIAVFDELGWVQDVSFNADGTAFATASYDGTIRIWGVP
jgi:WD40 repeat protein